MNKILVIDKPKTYTSRDVVNIISKQFKTKKVGHFGTLDPLATGVLVIGVGAFTKLGNILEHDDKEYICEVLVGKSTDTYDVLGEVVEEVKIDNIDKDLLRDVLYKFKKKYLQEVPIYSAVKVNGKKLYEYARNNESVLLPKKEVDIKEIELLNVDKKTDGLYFCFRAVVSKGTYIRSLINDISKELNIPLCMSDLRRVRQDKFLIANANTLEDIKTLSFKEINLEDVIDCSKEEITSLYEKIILNYGLIKYKSNTKFIIFTKNNENIVLYGPYEKDCNYMKPYIILKEN